MKSTDEVPSGITIPQLNPPLADPTPFVTPVVQVATIGLVTVLVKFENEEPEKYAIWADELGKNPSVSLGISS